MVNVPGKAKKCGCSGGASHLHGGRCPQPERKPEGAEGEAAAGAQLPGSGGRRRSRGREPTVTTRN